MNLLASWHRGDNVELERAKCRDSEDLGSGSILTFRFAPKHVLDNYFVFCRMQSWCKEPAMYDFVKCEETHK